jgi:hypothetical protein
MECDTSSDFSSFVLEDGKGAHSAPFAKLLPVPLTRLCKLVMRLAATQHCRRGHGDQRESERKGSAFVDILHQQNTQGSE